MASLRARAHLALLTLITALIGSCGDSACACEPVIPLGGNYQATRLRFTPAGQATVDALSGGATLSLTLSGSGTTTGTLFVPAALNGGTPVTFDLTGTYQLSGSQVTFTHNADTFIRDLTWLWQGGTILTTGSAGGVQYDVVLTRQ